MTAARPTAAEAYRAAQAEARGLLTDLAASIEASPARVDWGHVGSLRYVIGLLGLLERAKVSA